uniref:Hypothetical chloroplast RF1 n=1 Tax=Drosophyllum lusitanicum TaxID=4373 RepID=A0A411L5F8_DROLU|nr:hypothetical protein RF1 [Drosophyllum lusitanicum]QBE87537.1 hypothetical chloroplast RF1 [Drosophyllum lusitanicum]
MILKSFLLDNLLSLCMKIINSVVVVGLYYGFLTTFSIGPSYLFLLRAQVMEEPTEKKVSATTGFFLGQLIMLISIYYTPLYLALGKPHTITVLTLPYLLFHFFWNNHKLFFDERPITNISMRNFNTQYIFINNFIFQLFNHFLLPSSILFRLVNIYMFRCNNKLLFLTSSFIGWLIGHIFFMKWLEFILVWIRDLIRWTPFIQFIQWTKYFVLELRNSMSRIFSILLFIICIYYLGGMPSPIFTHKMKEISEEGNQGEEQIDVEIEDEIILKIEKTYTNGETKRTKKGFTEKENDSTILFSEEEKKKNLLWFDEKPLVTLLFDYKRWNRPLRYIKNNQFENTVKNETSQYFFYTCKNDGKERVSFTYPPSLSTFWAMIQRKNPFYIMYRTNKFFSEELNNFDYWIYSNEEKGNSLTNEFRNRIEVLDTDYLYKDVLEKKTRLCKDKRKKEYLTTKWDPLLNGPYRGIKNKLFLPAMLNEIALKNSVETLLINKVHSLILNQYNCHKFQQKKNLFDTKSLSREISYFLILISEFAGESLLKGLFLFPEQGRIDSQGRENVFDFLFDSSIMYSMAQTTKKKSIGIKEISKKVPQWSYKLIDDLEQQGENDVTADDQIQIRSRKWKPVLIFTDTEPNEDTYPNTKTTDQADEVTLIHYSQQSDFRRDIIKGSMRIQRRKIGIWKLLQTNVHSPIFLDRIDKFPFLNFDISELLKVKGIFKKKIKMSNYTEEKKDRSKKEEYKREEEKRKDKVRIQIAQRWDTIPFAQVIRGFLLLTQSILRKYVILPFLIIVKNMGRILLFQFPEWSEDIKEWNREIHVKCTYNGVQLSEREFPKNWLTEGIQIKILFPFCLKPWHKSKIRLYAREQMKKKEQKPKEDFCFLTVLGMQTELPFGSPLKQPSFFEPIFKELEKKMKKIRKNVFRVLIIFKGRNIFFSKIPKETKKWIFTNLLFLKKIRKTLLKGNQIQIPVLELRENSSEIKKEKDSKMNNQIIHKSSIQPGSMNSKNISLTEKKMKDLSDRTNTIKNKIERITKEKKNQFLTLNSNPKKPSYGTKRIESKKNICQILTRRNNQLTRKSHYFIKFFRERIYRNLFLYINNIQKKNSQPFLESKKEIIDTCSYNKETNQEKIKKRNKNKIPFISTIKKKKSLTLSSINKIKYKNSNLFFDFSFLSQAHVFYKLSKNKVLNLYKLRSILEYQGISLFLKNEIKDFFRIQGIIHSQFKHKKLQNSGIKQWKIWLKSHYQYDLSPIKWSRLVPKKWRNRVNQHCKVKNKNLSKWDSYEKDQLIHYKKKNDFEAHVLLNKKIKITKTYRYDLLSYKFLYYENNKDSYNSESPFQVNNNQKINSTNNDYNTHKTKEVTMWGSLSIANSPGKDNIIDMNKNPDIKFFDWRIFNFCLIKKADIGDWISTNSSQNTKTKIDNYEICEKIDKKGLFYLLIHEEINLFNPPPKTLDWMGMNEEILNHPISNLELWFFPEVVLFYNAYKMKPWIIPIKSLFFNSFHSNVNNTLSETKNINKKQKKDLFLFLVSNEKKSLALELENRNQKTIGQSVSDFENHKFVLSKEQKDIEEDYTGSYLKNLPNKKQNKSSTEVELDFFLKRYLLFQLRWDDPLNQKLINNIKVYCLLLRLKNPREIAISSIARKEMNLDIMRIQKDFSLTELMKSGILIIESIRLSIQSNGQFIMYQTIGISLVHKSKDKKNQNKKRLKSYKNLDKKIFDESIARHQKMKKNQYKNHYDLFYPENLFSTRRRKELRILICFNSTNNNGVDKNTVFYNTNKVKIKNCDQFFDQSKDKNNLIKIKLKLFLWPNYRLEDLACMNRYWFDTTNGSRFSMLRIHMYPRLKIH